VRRFRCGCRFGNRLCRKCGSDDEVLIRESLHIVPEMEPDFEGLGIAENGRVAVGKTKQEGMIETAMIEMIEVKVTERAKAELRKWMPKEQEWLGLRLMIEMEGG
jgi:hypothetical protein